MQVLFSPAIGEAVHIPVSESRAPLDTLILQFKANLGKEDYTRVSKGHARVQLWSNIPVTPGQPQHHWKASDFQVADEQLVSIARFPPPNGRGTAGSRWVNLAALDQEAQPARVEQLVLNIPVDLSAFHGERRYGFTYRIVHGDGGITWLGAHGRDGTVVLTGAKVAEVELDEAWAQAGEELGGHGLVREVPDGAQGQGIAKFPNFGDYQVWSFDTNQCLQSSSSALVQGARALVMLPRIQGRRVFNEPAYLLSASGDALLAISPSTGVATATGSGSVLLQTCYNPWHIGTLVPAALAYSGLADSVRVVTTEHWMLLLSPRDHSPARGLFIPTSPPKGRGHNTITFDFAALAEILTSPLKEVVPPEFCIFSPHTNDIEYIDTKRTVGLSVDGDSEVSFGVPSYGGEFTLSRVYDISDQATDVSCKVSLLTSHGSVTISQPTASIVLPTPPPSPFLNPRKRQSSATVKFSPDPVVIPRVDTVDIDGQLLRQRSNAAKSNEASEAAAPPPSSEAGLDRRSAPSGVVARQPGFLNLIQSILSLIRLYSGAIFYLIYIMSPAQLLGRRPTSRPAEVSAPVSGVGEDVDEPSSEGASTGARFDVGVEDSGEESEGSDETASDITVTGDEQNLPNEDGDGKAGTEPTPAPILAEPTAVRPDKDASTSLPPSDELLSAELLPVPKQPGGRVRARLALLTSGTKQNGDVTLSRLRRSLTLNDDALEEVTICTLDDGNGKAARDSWAYHLVDFATHETTPTVLKILNRV